jgi:hypothetical protein
MSSAILMMEAMKLLVLLLILSIPVCLHLLMLLASSGCARLIALWIQGWLVHPM